MTKDQIDALLKTLDQASKLFGTGQIQHEAADCIRELQHEVEHAWERQESWERDANTYAKEMYKREAAIIELQAENAHLIQQYGELQEAARKVIRYWGIRHESYLKEYVTNMDSVIQKHIQEAE